MPIGSQPVETIDGPELAERGKAVPNRIPWRFDTSLRLQSGRAGLPKERIQEGLRDADPEGTPGPVCSEPVPR